jgi:hypothetical protein
MKMTEEEKKKKKGVAIVIAVTPHAPKKPEKTMKPDDKPMKKAWSILKRRAWSNKIMPALGITPREHEQRMLNDMAAVGRDEYAQGRYQRGELPKHMIDTEEQQENEEFFADDLDMPEIDEDDPFIGDTSSRKPKPEDYHPDPFEMYEMFRQD